MIIHRTDLASYGWEVVRNSMGTERSYLKREGTPKLEAASWVQLEIAKKIVAAGGSDLDKLYQQAQSRGFRPVELPVKLKVHDSIFVPLAKWPMLIAGNYRCIRPNDMISIKEAVHGNIEASRQIWAVACTAMQLRQ